MTPEQIPDPTSPESAGTGASPPRVAARGDWLARLVPGLGPRLGLMMMLALLPLGLLAISQTVRVTNQAERVALDSVLGATLQAAAGEIAVIRKARATAAMLAVAVRPLVNDEAACDRLMDSATAVEPTATFVGYIPPSAVMTCAAFGATYDFAESANFHRSIGLTEPGMVVNQSGPVSGTSVVGITNPVFDDAGEQIGFVAISIPHHAITVAPGGPLPEPIDHITFRADGTILTSSSGLDSAADRLPMGKSLTELATGESQTFFGVSRLGFRRIFGVVPIEGDLFLLGSWPVEAGGTMRTSPYLFPVLMWIAGLAVALLASDRLVSRHVRRLSRSMLAFTRGARNLPPVGLDHPPTELASLADTYATLTSTILRDEADLENLVHEKEDLLREVHHRTGNSLQLIASILRMHLRENPPDEMREILENLHDRVMSLSTVHFGLYRVAGRQDVPVDALMSDVIAKIAAIHGRFGRKDAIEADLGHLMLSSQQAVPLALLLAEILSCFPAVELGEGAPLVRVTLDTLDNDRACLAITGSDTARGALTGEGQGVPEIIAGRLIRAFVLQIGGTMEVTDSDGRVRVKITFPRRSEQRAAMAGVATGT